MCKDFYVYDIFGNKLIDFTYEYKFLIGGSTYKGYHELKAFDLWTGHLNGVALYRNCDTLSILLEKAESLILYNVKMKIDTHINYDLAIHYIRFTLWGEEVFNNIKVDENRLVDIPIINNYSLDIDSAISIHEILDVYPDTIILHQKPYDIDNLIEKEVIKETET